MKKRLQKLAVATSSAVAAFPLLATGVSAEAIGAELGTGFFTDIGQLFNTVLRFVLIISALLVFVYLIWGGIEWVTSGGDKGKTESARNKITAAVIGLVIVAASYAIFTLIIKAVLGVDDINTLINP
ncbi:MAG: hypothetical protein OEX81_03185 [Candidatus Pacebacteria bacterium]|nr:hypothetical protein [Candidatus Paceibacterota bacterium]